jgi:hypothetical protein
MGALRAATVIATLHQDDIGTQASRICQRWMTQYSWKPSEINREIIDAIERHYNPATLPVPPAPWTIWTAIQRATAPPSQRPATTKWTQLPVSTRPHLARTVSRERELAQQRPGQLDSRVS